MQARGAPVIGRVGDREVTGKELARLDKNCALIAAEFLSRTLIRRRYKEKKERRRRENLVFERIVRGPV